MSMESHVMFRGPLPARAAVNGALKELGFPVAIGGRGGLEGHRGLMPVRLRRAAAGVEFDVFDDQELLARFAGEIDPAFDRTASFRWGGDEDEMLAGLCTAAALAHLLDAAVFDEAEDALLDADGAIAVARKNLQAVAAAAEAEKAKGRQPGTRPADLKRYLKPLLALRPDLALVDRSLVIKPVRHVLRGAFLDRSDRHSLHVHRLLVPLYNPHFDIVQADRLHGLWHVWEDHFQALLLDQLAEQVFGPVGQVTSLSGFAQDMLGRIDRRGNLAQVRAPVRAFILAGEAERAVAYVEDLERKHAVNGVVPHYISEMRAELGRDIGELCLEQHAREAKVVADLKLQGVWEPAPFPVEVPQARRTVECDDAPFSTAPWVATPAGLFADEPEGIDEPVFSQDQMKRAGRQVLLVPLSREEAERRHQAREEYHLTVRPAEDRHLVVYYRGRTPKDPSANPDAAYVWPLHIWFWLLAPDWCARACFWEEGNHRGRLGEVSVEVFDPRTGVTAWTSKLDPRAGRRRVRKGDTSAEIAMTEAEMAPHLRADFAFGDYRALLRTVDAYARLDGFGPLSGATEPQA